MGQELAWIVGHKPWCIHPDLEQHGIVCGETDHQIPNSIYFAWYVRMTITIIRDARPKVEETEEVGVLNKIMVLVCSDFNLLICILNLFLYLQILCFHQIRSAISSKWLTCAKRYWRKQHVSERNILMGRWRIVISPTISQVSYVSSINSWKSQCC